MAHRPMNIALGLSVSVCCKYRKNCFRTWNILLNFLGYCLWWTFMNMTCTWASRLRTKFKFVARIAMLGFMKVLKAGIWTWDASFGFWGFSSLQGNDDPFGCKCSDSFCRGTADYFCKNVMEWANYRKVLILIKSCKAIVSLIFRGEKALLVLRTGKSPRAVHAGHCMSWEDIRGGRINLSSASAGSVAALPEILLQSVGPFHSWELEEKQRGQTDTESCKLRNLEELKESRDIMFHVSEAHLGLRVAVVQ